MAAARDREIRRMILRFLNVTSTGEEYSRTLHQELISYGLKVVWHDFDRALVYLERAGCITLRSLEEEISLARMVRITQRGLDILEGTLRDPGILPPAEFR